MRNLSALFIFIIFSFQLPAQKTGDLFDDTYVHDIKIGFDQKNWMTQLDSLPPKGAGMVVGKVVIDGISYDKVGISYAQSLNYITENNRKPWLVKLDFVDKNQNHQGYTGFMLSQNPRDPSMVRAVLGYEIARKYMACPMANYVNLSVNEENRGIYVNVEAINDHFLQKNFQYTEGSFFSCIPDTNTTIKGICENSYGSLKVQQDPRCMMVHFNMLSKTGWNDLTELIRVLNAEPQHLSKVLNLDQTLWFLAFHNVVVNLNSYNGQNSGNYYLYRDKNNQFNFIPTELQSAFGGLKNLTDSHLNLNNLTTFDPLLHADNSSKPLIAQLLKNQDIRKIYFSHVKQILSDWFDNNAYKSRAEVLQKMIMTFYGKDKTPPFTSDELKRSLMETVGSNNVPGLVELMSARTKYLKKYPDLAVVAPVVSEVNFINRKKSVSPAMIKEFQISAKVDKFPRRIRVFYRPLGTTTPFTELQMLDDGKNNDAEAGDKIFGIVINPMGNFDRMEYYIIAENAGAATFYPANYFAEKAKMTLEEINR